MEKLKYLLNNYIVYKSSDEDMFYSIKENSSIYKKFIDEYLKYKLIVRSDFLKLEKIPGKQHFSMGIKSFTSTLDYVVFLKLLYFLDNAEKGKQFLFSDLKDSINLNWLEGKNRISLTRVLKYAIEIPLIKVIDKAESDLEEKEMLLESCGISRYLITSIYKEDEKDIIDLKTKVYRDLVMNNTIYSEQQEEYEYCKEHKDEIDTILEKYLNWNIQIHKNMVVTVVNDNLNIFNGFPGRSDDDKICLQFNALIREKIALGLFEVDAEEILFLKEFQIDTLIGELREKNETKWTKLSREKKNEHIKKDIFKILEFFNFISRIDESTVKIYPLSGKIVGEYNE